MKARHMVVIAAIVSAGTIVLASSARPSLAAEPKISFEDDVVPILAGRCVSCHTPPEGQGYKESGLDLTSYEGIMKGTKFGPMIVPGNPVNSNLMHLLDWRAKPELKMPHGKKKLSVCDRNTIRTWIRQGAKDN